MTEDQRIRMERYLGGKMGSRERQAFEEEVRRVPAWAALLQEHWQMQTALDQAALARQMQRVESLPDLTGDRGWQIQRRWTAAARWSLLAGAISLLLWFSLPEGDASLFEEYHRPPLRLAGNTLNSRPLQQSLRAALVLPMDAYGQGDYRAALAGMRELEATYPANDTLRFYLAACHLALDEPQDALALLRPLTDAGPYALEARWYAALASLRQGDRAAAQGWLQRIEAGTPRSESARQLAQKLGQTIR